MLRTILVVANNIYCVPTYLVWMFLLLPLRKIHETYYYRIEGILFHWLLANVSMWSWTAGYEGESLTRHNPNSSADWASTCVRV